MESAHFGSISNLEANNLIRRRSRWLSIEEINTNGSSEIFEAFLVIHFRTDMSSIRPALITDIAPSIRPTKEASEPRAAEYDSSPSRARVDPLNHRDHVQNRNQFWLDLRRQNHESVLAHSRNP